MKKTTLSALLGATLLLASCSDSDTADKNLSMQIKAEEGAQTLRSSNGLAISDFTVVLDKVEFEMDDDFGDDDDDEQQDNPQLFFPDEYEFEGPFSVDLIKDFRPQTFALPATTLPAGVIEEVEIDIEASNRLGKEHPMYGKSYQIAGTYLDTPFRLWHNEDVEIEAEYDDDEAPVWMDGKHVAMDLRFRMFYALQAINKVDFSRFRDGNGNGVLEIGPGNTDGNPSVEVLKDIDDKWCGLGR